MIKKFGNWENTRAFNDYQTLPKGAYICKIMKAEVMDGSWGVRISYDVAEGDYKDFWANEYRNQTGEDKFWRGTFLLYLPTEDGSKNDEMTKRRFRTFTDHLEDVNSGYHWDWDETRLKGKMFGGLFRIRQSKSKSNGKIYDNLEPNSFASLENIRNGKYKLPDDYLLSDNGSSGSSASDSSFTNTDSSDDLPF